MVLEDTDGGADEGSASELSVGEDDRPDGEPRVDLLEIRANHIISSHIPFNDESSEFVSLGVSLMDKPLESVWVGY